MAIRMQIFRSDFFRSIRLHILGVLSQIPAAELVISAHLALQPLVIGTVRGRRVHALFHIL
jgi:hypothetical protein